MPAQHKFVVLIELELETGKFLEERHDIALKRTHCAAGEDEIFCGRGDAGDVKQPQDVVDPGLTRPNRSFENKVIGAISEVVVEDSGLSIRELEL